MDMQKQEGAPWEDERWLEEQLKREAAIFEEPAGPERAPQPEPPRPAPEHTPQPDAPGRETPQPDAPGRETPQPEALRPAPAPEPMSQRPSLEGQPLEGRLPAPLEQPVPAPAPAVPGRAGNGGKRFSRKELRNGIRMAVLLGTPKALQKEGDEFECWKR